MVGEPLCDLARLEITFLSPKIFIWVYLMKIKWLIADVPAVGSLAEQKVAFFGLCLSSFGRFDCFCSPRRATL